MTAASLSGKENRTELTKSQTAKDEMTMCGSWIRPFVVAAACSACQTTLAQSLEFSTYWGSGGANNRTVVIDRTGNVYMSGGTSQTDWPTTFGAAHAGGGESDVTIAKFAPDGELIWSRLLGGPSEDYAYVSAVGPKGELYVSGRAGTGFPTTSDAFDRTFNGGIGGGPHPDGELLYSTYIGGNGDENGRAIHLLPSGRLIVAGGNTTSTNLPTDRGTATGPVLKPRRGGSKDSWVAMLSADGCSLDFCTYFGPDDDRERRGDETVRALGVDATGNIWIGGTTHGSDMTPTPDAFQKDRGSPPPAGEAYVAKLSPDGRRLVYFSWLGGSGNDEIETEGVSDTTGNFYVAGSTASADFPATANAFQRHLKGGGQGAWDGDGWVAKINNDGSLGFATLYGGTAVGNEGFFGPVVDPQGNVYCTGRFRSTDCPVTPNAFQPRKAGPPGTQDAMLVAFSPDGQRLLHGTYFGGSEADHGRHIGIHPEGNFVCIIGETRSRDLPLPNAVQSQPSGAFLTKFTVAKESQCP
jgi:hypothetical protein